MKYAFRLVTALAAVLWFLACSKDEPTGIKVRDPENQTPPVTGEESIPDYADDYSSIAGWDYHVKWNLANVHDPSVAWYNGYYYMYGTDASYGNEHLKAPQGRHFPGKRSKDLVTWEYIPGPMNEAPSWVKEKLNAIRKDMGLAAISNPDYGYWAPVVRNVGGKLRMYYCIVVNNNISGGSSWTERAFIGMCESTDPAGGKWEDKGYVTCSSSDKGKDGWGRNGSGDWDAYFYYNAIDPTYIIAPDGKHWLIHGSWHSGFTLLEIDPASGMPVKPVGDPWADSPEGLAANGFGKRIGARNGSRWQGSEAPEIVYKDGYYYLFMAYDGLDIPYNTRVVRAEKIEGPYYDITGRNFTNARGDCYPIVTHPYKFSQGYGWVGISHCCIFQQEDTGDWFYCSQGRLPAGAGGNAYANAIMMGHVRRIVWCPSSASDLADLWPIALPERYAGLSKTTVKKEDLAGTWEHINLQYKYGEQVSSGNLILNGSGNMSGALTGTWSFDEGKQYLTLSPSAGPSVVVVVAREADWEASPRVATLVYAGTEKSLNATYWGKKVK